MTEHLASFDEAMEAEVTAVRSDESLVRTEQLPEDRIAELAQSGRPTGVAS